MILIIGFIEIKMNGFKLTNEHLIKLFETITEDFTNKEIATLFELKYRTITNLIPKATMELIGLKLTINDLRALSTNEIMKTEDINAILEHAKNSGHSLETKLKHYWRPKKNDIN